MWSRFLENEFKIENIDYDGFYLAEILYWYALYEFYETF